MPLDNDSDDDLGPLTFDASSGKAINPPRKRRRQQTRLRTLDDIKKEMEKLYRSLKADEIQPKKANSQIYLLEKIMAITAAKEYGTRLEAIEKKLLQGFTETPQIPE